MPLNAVVLSILAKHAGIDSAVERLAETLKDVELRREIYYSIDDENVTMYEVNVVMDALIENLRGSTG